MDKDLNRLCAVMDVEFIVSWFLQKVTQFIGKN